MAILEELSQLLQKGKVKNVVALVTQALEEGISPEEILNDGLLKVMSEVGVKFKNNQVYVPEVLIAARALNRAWRCSSPVWWRPEPSRSARWSSVRCRGICTTSVKIWCR